MKKLLIGAFAITLMAIFYWLMPHPNETNNGPILYAISSDGVVYKIDPMTCDACPILDPPGLSGVGISDLVVLPNGNILVQTIDGLRLYNPPNPDPIWSSNIAYGGSILAPNGLVYLSQAGNTPGLFVYDPATNNVTFIGNWPPNIIVNEFFYQGGILYANGVEGPPPFMQRIIQVDLNNPELSTIVVMNSPFSTNGGMTTNGYNTSIISSSILRQYDVSTNTYTTLCTLPAGMNGLTDLPTGVTEAACLCITFAGTVSNQTFNVCVPGSVTVPYNNDATLDGNDILRYILFSDLNDTLGSILLQSSSATIPFNPAIMQTGVTYYLATLAGNNQGGNVDLSDPCLDVSNTAAQVIWRPSPAVLLSVANPDVCAGGCTFITATFTGTPPFVITYTDPTTGGTTTKTFSANTGTFEVCTQAGMPPGSLTVEATGLTDAWCSCN